VILRRPMSRTALLVLACLLCSVPLGAAVWFVALVGTQHLCMSLYGDFRVGLFGDRHQGLFAEYVHWLPVAAGASALAVPWLWLVWHDLRAERSKKLAARPN
jgi:hypothetical protein